MKRMSPKTQLLISRLLSAIDYAHDKFGDDYAGRLDPVWEHAETLREYSAARLADRL